MSVRALPVRPENQRSPLRNWPLLVIGLAVLLIAARDGFAGMPLLVDYAGAPARGAPTVAVVMSGDLGLAIGMGHRIAERLEAAGIPTVGVNAPAFFLHRRTPGEVAGLVERAARKALAGHPQARLVLIGQSFGADVLPAGINRLPEDLRRRLALVALVVPTRTVYFRISPAEYFEFGKPDADARHEAAALDAAPLLCVYGERESDSLCPLLSGPRFTRVALPGGHPLRRDADRLFATLRHAILRTTGEPS
jgi:type IV secretory pathway VirJ component